MNGAGDKRPAAAKSGSSRQTAFLTGAGSGIGRRLAELLLERGTGAALFDLRFADDARVQLEEASRGAGVACSFHEVDVRDARALQTAVDAAVSVVGPPGLAVNSAGVQISKAFRELTADEFELVVGVNLIGSRNFAASVLPRMQRGSRLALIASLAGIVPNYGYAAYSASKFGVMGLAGALRLEYRPSGINVSVICPPEVETPMVAVEHETGDPVSLELKKFSGTLSLDDASRQILAGLDAGTWMIVPGHRARLTRRLGQFLPGLMNAVSDRMVNRAMKERPGSLPTREI